MDQLRPEVRSRLWHRSMALDTERAFAIARHHIHHRDRVTFDDDEFANYVLLARSNISEVACEEYIHTPVKKELVKLVDRDVDSSESLNRSI